MTDLYFFLLILGMMLLALAITVFLVIALWRENDTLHRRLDAANRNLSKEERL